MRPADYSEEQIVEAGRALQEAGKRVTPFGIRERMGGGKPQRIREIWERYVAGESEQSAGPEQVVELPAEFEEQVQGMNTALINDLTALAKRLYGRADEIAESRTREAMQAAKKAKESAETDVAEAERLIEDQDAKIEALEAQVAALRAELATAKRENRRLESECRDAQDAKRDSQSPFRPRLSRQPISAPAVPVTDATPHLRELRAGCAFGSRDDWTVADSSYCTDLWRLRTPVVL